MCRLIKSNKLVVLTLYSSYLYPLVHVLRSVLDQDLLNKPHHISHTDTLIFNSELYCLSISSSSFLPTIHHVQASSRCARPKYALHAPSSKCRHFFLTIVASGIHEYSYYSTEVLVIYLVNPTSTLSVYIYICHGPARY